MQAITRRTGGGLSLFKLLMMMIVFGLTAQFLFIVLAWVYMKFTHPDQVFNFALIEQSSLGLKLLLGVSSIATFVLPPFVLNNMENKQHDYFVKKSPISIIQYAYVFAAMLCFIPMMGLIGNWNESMQLPASLQGLQEWMRESEDSAAAMTKLIVEESTWSGLILNLVILAVIPAIGEELIFRGCLQNIFGSWILNKHVVIWVVAIIFSAFHLQFFGFLPRLILGAFFGYLYVWSKNIYLPIFGHFVNNASATITAFYYSRKGTSFEEMNKFEMESIWVYVASLVFTVIFVAIYRNSTKKINNGARLEKD